MPDYSLAPVPRAQFFDVNGSPVAGGLLYSYVSGTSTPLATFQDHAGTPNSNPTVLDSSGRATVWLGPGSYSLTLKDATGAQVWSVSNVSSPAQIADIAAAAVAVRGSSFLSDHVRIAVPQSARSGSSANVRDFGAVCDGVADDSAAINAALSSGAGAVTGAGYTCKVNTNLKIPAGVTLENISLQAGTAGMNVCLVNTGSRLVGVKIRGTGTTQVTERGVYPAGDGVSGVHLDRVDISNLTFAIQAQPVSGSTVPARWFINAYIHDLVGKIGNSEGYGILLSPAVECEIHVRAYNLPRHALYLSAGASRNLAWVQADTIMNYCVQLFATAAQPECAENEIWLDATNVSNASGQTGQAYACGLIQNTNRNHVHVRIDSAGATDGAVWVQGVGATGGPYPADNVLEVTATGIYTGYAVVNSTDADNTRLVNSTIRGHGASSLVNFGDTGGNIYSPKAAGSILNCSLDGLDSSTWGITNNAARGGLLSQSNRVINTAAAVKDYTGTRSGFHKSFSGKATFTGIAAGATSTSVITLPEAYSLNVSTQVTPVGISSLLPGVSAIVSAATSTSVTVALLNGSTAAQNSTVQLFITGD